MSGPSLSILGTLVLLKVELQLSQSQHCVLDNIKILGSAVSCMTLAYCYRLTHLVAFTMHDHSTQKDIINTYLYFMLLHNNLDPDKTFEDTCQQFNIDVAVILALQETHYLNGWDHRVPKAGNLHLAWEYAKDPADHYRYYRFHFLCWYYLV